MDSEIASYKNFQLVHQLKRRIRIISPVLIKDIERGYILEILLKKRPEIKKNPFSIFFGVCGYRF